MLRKYSDLWKLAAVEQDFRGSCGNSIPRGDEAMHVAQGALGERPDGSVALAAGSPLQPNLFRCPISVFRHSCRKMTLI